MSAVGLALWMFAVPCDTAELGERNREQHESAPASAKGLIPHWTGVIDRTGHCRYSVPATWIVERQPHGNALASEPHGMATAELDWLPSTSWRAYTGDLRRSLEPILIEEDTGGRLWFEYRAEWPGAHHYVAVPSNGGLCATWIDVRVGTNDRLKAIIRQIVQSVVALQ
jgi:hypothetical protein